MTKAFVSRPIWTPPPLTHKLKEFYKLLNEMDFSEHTIGTTQSPLNSPFEDVRALMSNCDCSIIIGLPYIFMHTGTIKHVAIESHLTLTTEWNQIEATMSLMLNLPTLILLHKTVATRGIFDRGAANVFVHEFDLMDSNHLESIKPALSALKGRAPRRLSPGT